MSTAWKGGSTREWRRIRARILARDGERCQLQTEVCTHVATEVHHTLGRKITGDDPGHLIAACKPCNQYVGEPKGDPSPAPRTEW